MNEILIALLAWLFAIGSGPTIGAPSAAPSEAVVASAEFHPRIVAPKVTASVPPTHPLVVVTATPSAGMRVGDYPYLYVQVYCDPYIYCQEAPGVLLSELGPVMHPPNLRPDLKDTFWVTVEAYQKYLAAQTPPPPDPIKP